MATGRPDYSDDASFVVSPREIKGSVNTGNIDSDGLNYCKVKLKFFARSDADAGDVTWITRVSYQYV